MARADQFDERVRGKLRARAMCIDNGRSGAVCRFASWFMNAPAKKFFSGYDWFFVVGISFPDDAPPRSFFPRDYSTKTQQYCRPSYGGSLFFVCAGGY